MLTARKPVGAGVASAAGAAYAPAATAARKTANWRRLNLPRFKSPSILSMVSIIRSSFHSLGIVPAKIGYESPVPVGQKLASSAGKPDVIVLFHSGLCHQPQTFSFRIVAYFAGRVEEHGCPVFSRVCGPMRQTIVIRIAGSGKIHPSSTDLLR